MIKFYKEILLIFLIVFAVIRCFSQDNSRSLLKKVSKENQEAVDAIAMYPTETRKIIFEATEYPEVIARLNEMQKNSQEAFEKLISSFSKEEQEKIWNLTRYNGLIPDLSSKERMSDDEINNILANYPEEIHITALEEQKKNYDLLVQMDKMNISYNSDFDALLNGYPPEADSVFREMIKMPEVLSLLFDHMQYTVVVGDYYKKNPERVLHKTDSLNLVLTQKNTQETNDWKQSMNDNPKVLEEYNLAAQEYAQDNGYQPEDYNAPLTPDVLDYNTNPYNWWFGYPSWYPYSYWNPYPYWNDWGFYYGNGRQAVFFGLPSSYFMDWYFYYPEHFSKYAELSDHYYNYYNRHRESMNNNSISHSVNDWCNRNKDIITEDWDKDNFDRTQRFKEYGQMEMERKSYNTKNPKNQIEQTEYLQKKQNKYPLLSADINKNQLNQKFSNSKSIQENVYEPVKKPKVTVPDNYKATLYEPKDKQTEQNIQRNKSNFQNNNINNQQQQAHVIIQQKNPNIIKSTENSNQERNAQQYHQNSWKEIQSQSSQPAQQPQQQNIQTPSNNKRK